MRQSIRFILAAVLVMFSVSIGNAIPQLINYQGILTDAGGIPVTTPQNVQFGIWDNSSGGTLLWSEIQAVSPDGAGSFGVLLGSVTPIPDSVFAGDATYLSVKVGIDPELSPRSRLVSVGYAYRPGTVDGASGGNILTNVSIGSNHTNTGLDAFVAGGFNAATGSRATIPGGQFNTASGQLSSISGGAGNTSSGVGATIGGGANNVASGTNASVSGGTFNTASGIAAVVAGGSENIASGDYSFAAGRKAQALHHGSFIWADDSLGNFGPFQTTGIGQFLIYAPGGVGIGMNTPSYPLDTKTGAFLSYGGVWTNASDRNKKENFRSVDNAELLELVAQLEISRWNYKADESAVQHIGPVAQEFHSLFGVGHDNRTISTIDPAGIALAAIQELHKRIQRIEVLESEMAELRRMMEEVKADRR